ncbi:exopolygalacturonase-like [Juglans microcarpa x Juglans regia]|uniref:exopolygalacturonase-like n=1 Tax=Juglans microcarpa x Juglans regia TaxID=2249226 RepID=UPI001B7F511B|nr:exopolygalacturonase-like [Juglans microcarpa x Juglans regia]
MASTCLNIGVIMLLLLLPSTVNAQYNVIDVTKYGAKSNGDLTQPLTNAWKDACAAGKPTRVFVPKTTYYLGAVTLKGPCKGPVELQVQGTIKAPADPKKLKDAWVVIQSVDRFILSGGGTFDGQGQMAWSQNNCLKTSACGPFAINLRFDYVTNSQIRDITSLNSKFFHMFVFGCKNLKIQQVTITAPGNSLNTDGIHIGRSSGINITGANIGTGDDCVSIGDGSQDITITKVNCGPGHGISIGSLGKYPNEQPVNGIKVISCTFNNAMNGVRIKTFAASPSSGTANQLYFEDMVMNNVGNPIIIDQEYCPYHNCKGQTPSKVKISNVSFKNIRGSSATAEAVKLTCSKSIPCQNVQLQNINLSYKGSGQAKSTCQNVKPSFSGTQNPPPCKA